MKFEDLAMGAGLLLLVLLVVVNSNPVVYDVALPKDDSGNLEVAIQDQFTEIVDLRLSYELADINITQNTVINQQWVIIESGIIPSVEDIICLKENKSFYQGEVLSVVSVGGNVYNVTLDKPLDFAYTTVGGCSLREDNWAVSASLANPIIFSVSPFGLNNVSWDITRVMLVCLGDGTSAPDPTPDLSSFFTMDSVTNGIVFRSVDGVTKNIFNAKDNFHLNSETYDLTIYPANRFGLFGVTSRRTFNGFDKNGVTVRLNSETSDRFDLIIQDDLTAMEECHAVVQGHVVD